MCAILHIVLSVNAIIINAAATKLTIANIF